MNLEDYELNGSLHGQLQEFDEILAELNSTPMGRRAFMASLPLLLSACATGDSSRYREGDNTGQRSALTVPQEKRMTQEVLPKMRKEYPPLRNAEVQNYVASLGRKLTRANGLEGNPYNYRFSAVDVGYVNAFALPAGTVFVTAPLIAAADSEAELIGVLGHEVGHVKARHSAERMYAAQKSQSKSWLYALGGAVLSGAAGYGLGRLLCPKGDRKCVQKATTIGAGAGALGGLLVQKYAFMQNSQEDELEADRIGFRTSVAAGYHKDHVGRFYDKLLKMEQKSKRGGNFLASFADALSTHPPSEQRVSQMRQMAYEEQRQRRAVVSTSEFDRVRRIAKAYTKRAQERARRSHG